MTSYKEAKVLNKKKNLFQANVLTQAKDGLNRDQRRLFYLMLDIISTKGWPKDNTFRIDHLYYSNIYCLSKKESREDIRKAMYEFKEKEITLYEDWKGENILIKDMSWTNSRWIVEKKGIYYIKMNPNLRKCMEPFFSQLPFTSYCLDQVSRVSSKYSMKLLEALSQFKSTGFFSIKIEDLRKRWELPNSYRKWSLLKSRVLDPSLSDINKIKDFSNVKMIERREGNNKKGKVISISFTFKAILFNKLYFSKNKIFK